MMLGGYDPVHQIPDGNNPDHLLVLDDWKMANTVLSDDSHALIDDMSRFDEDYATRHDFLDTGFLRGSSPQHNFPRIVALGNDSDELLVNDHQQCANVFVGHHFDRSIDC
jgi:hypothetical protein